MYVCVDVYVCESLQKLASYKYYVDLISSYITMYMCRGTCDVYINIQLIHDDLQLLYNYIVHIIAAFDNY